MQEASDPECAKISFGDKSNNAGHVLQNPLGSKTGIAQDRGYMEAWQRSSVLHRRELGTAGLPLARFRRASNPFKAAKRDE
jgi:hypothetical protein